MMLFLHMPQYKHLETGKEIFADKIIGVSSHSVRTVDIEFNLEDKQLAELNAEVGGYLLSDGTDLQYMRAKEFEALYKRR